VLDGFSADVMMLVSSLVKIGHPVEKSKGYTGRMVLLRVCFFPYRRKIDCNIKHVLIIRNF
jgi:hypothetical protein